MPGEENQLELFEDKDIPKYPKRIRRLPRRTLSRRRITLILPLERIALFLIALLLLFALSFVLGVEKGKRNAIFSFGIVEVEKQPEVAGKEEELPAKETKVAGADFYTVQVASETKIGFAERDLEVLQKNGYPGFILKNGRYLVIYAGTYSTPKEAREAQKKLNSLFPGCLVRKNVKTP